MSSTEMVVNYKFVEIWNFDIMLEFIQIYLEKKRNLLCYTIFRDNCRTSLSSRNRFLNMTLNPATSKDGDIFGVGG